jgi:hypothetical protein
MRRGDDLPFKEKTGTERGTMRMGEKKKGKEMTSVKKMERMDRASGRSAWPPSELPVP